MEINTDVLERWLENHRKLGGRLVIIPDIREFVVHDPNLTPNLYKKFASLSREQVEQFSLAEVFDNNMSDRHLMEDASKIWFLENEKITFLPQVVHEPWRDRWRAHPGSGRYDVLCRRGGAVPGVYIYFNEPYYVLPDHINLTNLELQDVIDNLCFTKIEHMDFTSYPAFSNYARERDSEWDPPDLGLVRNWEFIRWSEGKYFPDYKLSWRLCAVDLWDYLNI